MGIRITREGKKHDKRLSEEQELLFPKFSKLWKDTSFQGYEATEWGTTSRPKKKTKGGELH